MWLTKFTEYWSSAKLFVDMTRRVKVFGGDAKGFEEGNVAGVLPPWFCSGEDFADLGPDVAFGDSALFFWDEEIAGFVEEGFVFVCKEFCPDDCFGVDFAGSGSAGADDVEMGAGGEPLALDEGLGRCGDGADDVCVLD